MKPVMIPPIAPIMAPTKHSRPAVLTKEDPAVEAFFMDATPSLFFA